MRLADETLGNSEGRLERAVRVLDKELRERGECTVPELASLIAFGENELKNTRSWITEKKTKNFDKLAKLTSSTYEPGKGKQAGRFVR